MPSFADQFNKKKYIDFHGRSVVFVDVIPPVLKSGTPIFIAPGWGETPRTFKLLVRLLYEKGFRVLSVYHPRQDLKLITRNNISRVELQKAEIILEIIKKQDLSKIDIIAHSEGTVNSVIAACQKPELFRQLILIGPGGLVEKQSFPELIGRFLLNMFQDGGLSMFWNKDEFVAFFESTVDVLKYFLSNPILGLLEGSAISHTHIQKLLTDLHVANVPVTIVCGEKDIVFPRNRMKSLLTLEWLDVRDMQGSHDDVCIYPRRYIDLIESKTML